MKNVNSTETCADGRCEKQEGVDYQRDYTHHARYPRMSPTQKGRNTN
jgi:hypothetical protein